jgi:hypothetical protein
LQRAFPLGWGRHRDHSSETGRLARGSLFIGQHFNLPDGAAFVATLQNRESLVAARVFLVLHAALVAALLAFVERSVALKLIRLAFAGTQSHVDLPKKIEK